MYRKVNANVIKTTFQCNCKALRLRRFNTLKQCKYYYSHCKHGTVMVVKCGLNFTKCKCIPRLKGTRMKKKCKIQTYKCAHVTYVVRYCVKKGRLLKGNSSKFHVNNYVKRKRRKRVKKRKKRAKIIKRRTNPKRRAKKKTTTKKAASGERKKKRRRSGLVIFDSDDDGDQAALLNAAAGRDSDDFLLPTAIVPLNKGNANVGSHFCVKCKARTKSIGGYTTTTANGRRLYKSTCAKCKSLKSTFVKKS